MLLALLADSGNKDTLRGIVGDFIYIECLIVADNNFRLAKCGRNLRNLRNFATGESFHSKFNINIYGNDAEVMTITISYNYSRRIFTRTNPITNNI